MKLVVFLFFSLQGIYSVQKVESYVQTHQKEVRKLNDDKPVESVDELEELEGIPDEKDVYSFDMMNVEHAKNNAENDLVNNSKHYLSNYTKIMLIGETINKFYNKALGLNIKKQNQSQ